MTDDVADDANDADKADEVNEADEAQGEGLDPALAAILRALWDHTRSGPDKDLSLARISKRAGVQMSVLRRMLTQLAEADIVVTVMEEDGRGTVRLTEDGEALCGQLFDEPGDGASALLH